METPPVLSCLTCTADDLEQAINDPGLFRLKKSDGSTTVGILKGNAIGLPEELFIKRFNYKGRINFLAKLIFGSRARRVWKVSRRMREKDLPVPKPVACIEPTPGHRHGYLVSSVIENAERLSHAYRSGRCSVSEVIAQRLGETIARFHNAGGTHGDLKWPNILVRMGGGEPEFYFVDLDQATLHRKPNRKGIARDLVRFYRGGLELGAERWVEGQVLPHYLATLDRATRETIDLGSVRKQASRDWEKKGKRSL